MTGKPQTTRQAAEAKRIATEAAKERAKRIGALPLCKKCGAGYDPSVDPRGYANRLCHGCDQKKRYAHTCGWDHFGKGFMCAGCVHDALSGKERSTKVDKP